MFRSLRRSGQWPLAFLLTTIAACAGDDQPITAPLAVSSGPNLAVGDVITVTSNKGSTEAGTLRWAVAQTTGGEIIRFDARLAGATITLDSTLVIRYPITIEGPADEGVTISGGGAGRVIDITAIGSQSVTKLRNLSITGGKLPEGEGAGVRASSAVVIEHSTLFGNEAPYAPAILAMTYAPLTLVNSTVSGNTATGYLNHAVRVFDAATIDNSTIAYNSQGGIGFSEYHEAVLSNSIVANNGGFLNNCSFTEKVRHWGTNLSNDLSCGDSTVMRIADPRLDPLHDNGGPSMTHAVHRDSPAFNGTLCSLAVDQRYQPRDAKCDVGAFESTDVTTVALTIDRIGSVYAGKATIQGTVACAYGGDQFNVLVEIQQRGADKTSVQGSALMSATCATTPQPWTAVVTPSAGAFKSGGASAAAKTQQTPTWVAPADASKSIKLVAPEM